MFFSEKKRHRQPRSLSFGNCGWEGPLWLVRQSGQSDSPFPESQAGTRRLKEERHQAELDCLLLWTVRQGGRLNCFAAVHFFPFSLPCLLSLLPADSGGSLCSSPWKPPQLEGRVSEVCGLIFISLDTLSSSPAANGSRKESIKEKIGGTWWFVVFSWVTWWFLKAAGTGHRAAPGRWLGWHRIRRGSRVSLPAGPGIPSEQTNWESLRTSPL